jgi:enterochelin esterase-like enzyme
MRRLIVVLALLVASGEPRAAGAQATGRAAPRAGRGTLVTDTVWSAALSQKKHAVVYLPPSYATSKTTRYPVAIYLHGLWGGERDWTRAGHLDATLDSLIAAGMPEMIVVMPDGDDGWWTTWHRLPDVPACRAQTPRTGEPIDDYCVAWPHYDDYLAYDVVRFVDRRYRTIADRAHRGIAGLSMGGLGAVATALRFPRQFAAAASHSGVVQPREWAPLAIAQRIARPDSAAASYASWRKSLAPTMTLVFGPDSVGWVGRDPVTLLDRARASQAPLPAVYLDCGTSDIFAAENRLFRDALIARGVTPEYHEYPGDHTWSYWRAHAAQSLTWLAAQIAR